MLPSEPFLILLFVVSSLLLVLTTNEDEKVMLAPRVFLAVAFLGWAIFYLLVEFDAASLDVLVAMSRWLLIPTAVGVDVIVVLRWYRTRGKHVS